MARYGAQAMLGATLASGFKTGMTIPFEDAKSYSAFLCVHIAELVRDSSRLYPLPH